MNIKFNIRLIDFTIAQLGIVTLIIILGLISYVIGYVYHFSVLGFLRLLDVGNEQSIPTYFSVLNLVLSSILLFIIYNYEKANNHKGFNYWLFLSMLFLFLSVDESASIHEQFGRVHYYLAQKSIISPFLETHLWLPFGVLFVLIIGFVLFPFYKLLSRTTLYYFVISGLIFITGAIGFEYLGGLMLKTGFVESKTDVIYLIRRIFEEAFEMYGIALFNCALFREILNRNISLIIGSSTLSKADAI